MFGRSTRRMNKSDFSDLLNTILEFGDDQGVKWTDTRGIEEWL